MEILRIDRLEAILAELAKNKTADEIEQTLGSTKIYNQKPKSPKKRYRNPERLGKYSEDRVFKILSSLPFVGTIQMSRHFSNQDLKGIDMTVYFTKGTFYKLVDGIKVQVKSSQVGIEQFRDGIARRKHLGQEELNEYLKREKYIILNGREDEESIKQSFLTQLEEIMKLVIGPHKLREYKAQAEVLGFIRAKIDENIHNGDVLKILTELEKITPSIKIPLDSSD